MFRSNYFIYLNGNYIVQSDKSGCFLSKRCLRYSEDLRSEFPDSIDLKITNKCSWGCNFCHESSTPGGKSFDFNKTTKILSQLPQYPIEIAIGGGNVLEIPSETLRLVRWLKEKKFRPRITINYRDLNKDWGWGDKVNELINEIDVIGISITRYPEGVKLMVDKKWGNLGGLFNNTKINLSYKKRVIHIIAGITPPQDILKIAKSEIDSILILGYKQWGRNIDSPLPDMTETREILERIITEKESVETYSIGFDNLALSQLGIKDMVPRKKWEELYLGEEGSHSMYIDAVEEKFAITSRSPERVSWDKIGLLDYYATINNRN